MSINIKGRTVYGPNIVTDGLVLYLDAANTKSYPGSGTTWYDLSSGMNNGIISGSAYDSDNNGSFIFDGNDDVITLSESIYSTYYFFTFECWVKRNTINVTHGILSDQQYDFWTLSIQSTNKVRYHHYYTDPTYYHNQVISLSSVLTDWTHIAIVFNINSGTYMYINGVLDNSNTTTYPANISDLSSSRGPRFIGQYRTGASTGPYYTFDGKISNLKYYSKALTADEILQNYNAMKGRYL